MTHIQTKIIDDIFQALRACPLRVTQRHFSTSWLGRSSGYLAYLKSSGAAPDHASIELLQHKLERLADIFCNSPQFTDLRAQMLIWTLRLMLSQRSDNAGKSQQEIETGAAL